MTRRPDPLSLSAGIALFALGVLLFLDQADAIELTPGWVGAAVSAAIGSVLLANGLSRSR